MGNTALWHRLEKLGLSYKKTLRAAEQDREDLPAARQSWQRRQPEWDVRRLVFLDETGLNTKMTRLYGRSEVGERCLAKVPYGHWQTASFIAALRHDGVSAPWLIDGPMDGELFLTYVRQVLGPELRPGDLVICDNLASHKVRRRGGRCRLRRATPLPASLQPRSQPHKMAFSKLKALVRKAAARSFEQLLQATADALNTFSPQRCLNFFRHAQYSTT